MHVCVCVAKLNFAAVWKKRRKKRGEKVCGDRGENCTDPVAGGELGVTRVILDHLLHLLPRGGQRNLSQQTKQCP